MISSRDFFLLPRSPIKAVKVDFKSGGDGRAVVEKSYYENRVGLCLFDTRYWYIYAMSTCRPRSDMKRTEYRITMVTRVQTSRDLH